jgi:GNAT superfamily N-acetyltransferase/putative sterol carrier protein
MARIIRVLADRSKDSREGSIFTNLLSCVRERPGEQFQCTDNRLPLKQKLLSDYEVLVICGQSLKRYSESELKLIRQFVKDGGGLLLASNVAAFELEAAQPVETMAQNAVADLFGARFLSADCAGARAHGSLLIHPPFESLRTHQHPALGAHAVALVLQNHPAGPISPPPRARVLASCTATGEPIAAAFAHGKGRVVMAGTTGFAEERTFLCAALASWLAGNTQRESASKEVPAYIGGRGKIDRGSYFHVACEENCAHGMQEVVDLLQKIDAAYKDLFGKVWKPRRSLTVTDTLTPSTQMWWGSQAGGQAPVPSLARQIIRTLFWRAPWSFELYDFFLSLFSFRCWEIEFTVRLLMDIGFHAEADRCRARADRWIREMDKRAAAHDLARNYIASREECPRGLLVVRELLDSYGRDVVRKTVEAFPQKDPYKHVPQNYTWGSDRAIYYLSLAVGKDLFPWFARRGLSVHPLPTVKPTARNIRQRMSRRLNEALRDDAGTLSSRLDAALDLVSMGKEKDWLPPRANRPDDWTRLCRALHWSRQGDARADAELRKLFATNKNNALRAISGVALADLGDKSVEDKLVPLARKFEPRFQLAAGYALGKAGSARAKELSLENVTDAKGRRAGKLDVVFDGDLKIHGIVEGYRVNNIYSSPTLRTFTKDVALTSYFVQWVHTSPQWRRRGLSRCAMEATMNHPAARGCASSWLGTGTRNVAHRLYHDYGFTDMSPHREWSCALSNTVSPQLPTGVVFREYKEDDRTRVRAFVLETLGKMLNVLDFSFGELPPNVICYLAEREGKLVGLAAVTYEGGDEAQLRIVALAKDGQQAAIADSLLALLHRAVREAGARVMKWNAAGEYEDMVAALHRAGYVSRYTGGLWMMHIRRLDWFLREIAPAVEKRLAGSDFKTWEGKLDLVAPRLKGRLIISKGKVSAGRPTGAPGDVVMTCDDETAARVALGRETPFEAYLQSRLTLEPRISDNIIRLLETVFPKVPIL